MRKMVKTLWAGLVVLMVLMSAGCEFGTTEYTLDVTVNGSGSVSPSGGTYDEDTRVTLRATAASGWVFTGWSGDVSGTGSTIQVVMDSDKYVVANFSQASVDQYTLSVYTNGSGSVSPAGGTYDDGTTVNLRATAASGWEFSGWSGDVSGSSSTVQVLMNSDKYVTANFTETSSGETEVEYQAENSTLTSAVVESEHSGYTGSGYVNYANQTGSANAWTVSSASSGNVSVTFRYANGSSSARTMDIEVNGSVQVYDQSFGPSGGWASWAETTATLYLNSGANRIELVSSGSTGGPNMDRMVVKGDLSGETDYTLSVYTNGSGSVTPSGGTYAEGTTVTLTATASSGWVFSSWSGDVSGTNARVAVTMTSDKRITANFTEDSSGGDDLTAAEAVADMGIGWNLGNSLDALGNETSWGNPTVSRSLINTVQSAGFGVVRIPVTWIGHFGSAPNYTINASWLNRVEEVVNYVLDSGMYAIINIHHDGAEGIDGEWLALDVPGTTGTVTSSHNTQVRNQFKKIWEQVADRFKNYDHKLIFEAMNELHVGYGEPQSSYYSIISNLNQTFVDTVRASGGNNRDRILVVPGYNTNVDYTLAGFSRPSDTVSGKLILSCHYYDPWTFALQGSTQVWGAAYSGNDGWGQEDFVRQQFDRLKNTFINQGLPVIIGEYGAVNPNDSNYADFRRYYLEYVTKAAHDRGIVPIYWDNGSMSSGTEALGLFNRSGNYVQYPAVLNAMMRAVNSNYSINDIARP